MKYCNTLATSPNNPPGTPQAPQTPGTPKTPQTPGTPDTPQTPAPLGYSAFNAPSFRSVSSTSFGFTFGAGQSRHIQSIEVYDIDTKTLLSSKQTGCKYSWKGSLFRVSFTPSVTVANGQLIIHRKKALT